jgi:hypothetical protein
MRYRHSIVVMPESGMNGYAFARKKACPGNTGVSQPLPVAPPAIWMDNNFRQIGCGPGGVIVVH